jgi:hypothetical protein
VPTAERKSKLKEKYHLQHKDENFAFWIVILIFAF